jgi:hypothetical protein
VAIPALEKLGKKSGYMPASQAQTAIATISRSLQTATGATSRRRKALEEIDLLDQAEAQLNMQLSEKLGPEAGKIMGKATHDYARGKSIQRLFGYGRENITEARAKKLLENGEISEPMLERAFLSRSGELKKLFPKEYPALEQVVRRGETNPLKITKPGVPMHARFHLGFVPTVNPPHAPQRVGQPELTAEQVAQALRALGQRGLQAQFE